MNNRQGESTLYLYPTDGTELRITFFWSKDDRVVDAVGRLVFLDGQDVQLENYDEVADAAEKRGINMDQAEYSSRRNRRWYDE